MNKGFWEGLPRPIVGLSPMDGVTDAPMRVMAKKYGQPDVIYTEFVSTDGLWRIHKRGETTHKIWRDLRFEDEERPVIAQLFGSDPDSFYEATKIVAMMGFDGIDINMGCPSPGLEKRGGGAGLMRDFGLVHRVIEAVRRGVTDMGKDIPVSVKTRIGSKAPDKDWWEALAQEELPAVAMHGRTFKQLYSGSADWEVMKQAAEIIRESGALFLGNGDVKAVSSIKYQGLGMGHWGIETTFGEEIELGTDFDGVLVGRNALGNPWALRKDGYEPSVEEKLKVAIEHTRKFEEIFKELKESRTQGIKTGGKFQFFPMRKHLAWYAHGFEGAGGLRRKLVVCNSADEVEEIINEFLEQQ